MKTKILVVGPQPPPVGGIETCIREILDSGLKNKYKFITVNTSKNKLIKPNAILKCLFFIYNCVKIMIICLYYKSKLAHFHLSNKYGFWRPRIFVKITKFFGVKNIFHMHGGDFPNFYKYQNKTNRKKIKNTLKKVDKIIALTTKWKAYYSQFIDEKKIEILPNPINLNELSRYKKLNKRTNILRLLFVGKITEVKGIYELLKSIRDIDDIELRIMGFFDNNEKKIRRLCREYRIEKKVKFIGTIYGNKRFKYFNDVDIFILPSYYECMPITILEAMAFGLPIIATKVGGIPDIVSDKNAILIEPKKSESIRKAIEKLKNNSKKMKELSKNNLKDIKKFDIKNFMNKLENIYKSLE